MKLPRHLYYYCNVHILYDDACGKQTKEKCIYGITTSKKVIVFSLVTWLILPVVICLSQRLSHASLSISFDTTKLRMAHYNSYNLREGNYYTDNRGNSGANTCTTLDFGKVALIRLRTNLCLHSS
jgi:hypothetical protein